MVFERGFKKECDSIVLQIREELKTPDTRPLDMSALAESLSIRVDPIGNFTRASDRDSIWGERVYEKVSAITYFIRSKRHILYNERHSLPRHRSNLAHEFAHALLRHPPENHHACKGTLQRFEAEANWLGGVLMLSTPEAHRLASRGIDAGVLTRHQISRQMLIYRLQVTGAARRLGPMLSQRFVGIDVALGNGLTQGV